MPDAARKHDSAIARKTASTTFLDRDNWMRAINASGEPCGVRCLAIAIALRVNIKTGRCDPGHETLAKDAGMSIRSVERLIARLERCGWLMVRRGGWGKSNNYVLCWPDPPHMADQRPHRPATGLADQEADHERSDPPIRDSLTRQSVLTDPPHGGGQKDSEQKEENNRREERGKKRALAPGAALAPDAALALRDTSGDTRSTVQPKHELGREAEAETGFARFWEIYPRKVEQDDARAAFDKAIADGADAESVIAGAACYAALRAAQIRDGDDPKWTPYPAKWLRKRKWADPPPQGVVLDQYGNVVAVEPPPQRQRRNGHASNAELIAESKAKWAAQDAAWAAEVSDGHLH
jgi:hypothetical protein